MVTEDVTARSEDYAFDLSGGRLCLDFANTIGWRGRDEPNEHLGSYGDFIAWAELAVASWIVMGVGLARSSVLTIPPAP